MASQARVITVGGGRGSIGKSLVAAQLAWSLAQGGRRVALVDLDLAGPSLHLLVGARPVRPGQGGLVGPGSPGAGALLRETSHLNLLLIAGSDPALSPAALSPGVRTWLAEQLASLPVDVVVADVGAGVGYDPIDLLELGHHRLVVTSCEPTAVQDAFALLKAAVTRVVTRHLVPAGQLALLEPAVRTRDGERMSEVLRRVQFIDPILHAAIVRGLLGFGGALIGTQVPDITQVGALQTMSRMAAEYLGITVPLVGWLRRGVRLPDLAASGGSETSASGDEERALRQIGEAMLGSPTYIPAAHTEPVPPASLPAPSAGKSRAPPVPRDALVQAGRSKPVVYVRPPRKRLIAPPAAPIAETRGRRARQVRLPGMPPRREPS